MMIMKIIMMVIMAEMILNHHENFWTLDHVTNSAILLAS